MEKDISEHLSSCNKCQVTKVCKMAPELLSPLPQCTEPNQRVHADLFGPLKTSRPAQQSTTHNRHSVVLREKGQGHDYSTTACGTTGQGLTRRWLGCARQPRPTKN
jgi:hypothetical protein